MVQSVKSKILDSKRSDTETSTVLIDPSFSQAFKVFGLFSIGTFTKYTNILRMFTLKQLKPLWEKKT